MTILFSLSHINKSLQWEWFAEEMKNRGISQVYVLINSPQNLKPDYFREDLEKLGIPVYTLVKKNLFSHIKNIITTVKIIRKHNVDLVHTSLPYGNLIGQLAALFAGIRKRVTTCENASWAHDFGSKRHERIDKITYKTAKKVIAVADSARDYLKDHFHLPDQKLTTIYHGLKESEYQQIAPERLDRLRKELEIRPGQFIVGVIARYEFWKGHEFINRAAAILKERGQEKDIRILIFGSKGSYYQTAMQQIKTLGVGDLVEYRGFCDDPVALFQVFDVHLHVPVNKYVENCGINIIEGMISARPQILTRSGYAWQSAKHMKNSLVVNYESAEDIANAILFMKSNRNIATSLASQAKIDAVEQYGLKTKVDRHLELYNSLD